MTFVPKNYATLGIFCTRTNEKFNVETVCTTDDPVDSLEYHLALKRRFRNKSTACMAPRQSNGSGKSHRIPRIFGKTLKVSGVTIGKFSDLIEALRKRHDFFASAGCKLSDHGIEEFYAEPYTQRNRLHFNKVYGEKNYLKKKS